MKRFNCIFLVVSIIIFSNIPSLANACTLWAGAGDNIVGGGTIISKNRDWLPDHQQQIRLFSQGGYRFISLYAEGNAATGTKQGINEKGLCIITASAPRTLKKPEYYQGMTPTRTLLSRYDSVESAIEALKAGKWACGPEYLVLADGKEIACIEFGLNGSYEIISQVNSGIVVHTNHYVAPGFAVLNPDKHSNSQQRYERIKEFLDSKDSFDVSDFQRYSLDPVLWREGVTPVSTRTLSSWILKELPDGTGTLYLRMANPGKTVKDYEFALKDLFDGTVDLSSIE